MPIEQNNFNNLVTQIETIHQTLQAQAIKSVSNPQIDVKKLLNSCSFTHLISIENEHNRIDLLFYHRILKCNVLIDLKIREFIEDEMESLNE